ncbi:anti-sigma-D factor RsdA [Antrihabitans sp. YC2-6]|uniref:anti-sigma-D factor RsdA n=1 Tax=Antrihabitans sp. YC2-6 TaxID=2799498 RepID=UPI0018F4137E|nr:anti-sigma-D factor RsdA [Antrihabitans sp. YC2-6]MBJ8347424.1 type IV secretion protein Rhs [Antrihabitans sp. YC2-6]
MARDGKRGRFGAGSQHSDPSAESAVGESGPLDIAAVRRDDELIDAIASDGPVATDSAEEYEIATLLASWRAELTGPPLPAAPDLDAVVAAVNQEIGARTARVRAGGKLRIVRPIIGAAAAIAVVVGAMTAFSYNAEPGDALWKVKQVVFSDQADSTVANIDTTSDLQEAEELIAAGNPQEAQRVLERASTRVSGVNDAGQREDLVTQLSKLADEVRKQLPVFPLPTSPVSTTSANAPEATTTDLPVGPTVDPADPRRTAATSATDPNPSQAATIDTSVLLSPPPPVDTTTDPTTPVETTAEQPPVVEPTTTPPPVIEEPTTTQPQEPSAELPTTTAAAPVS